jgi:hypothetical protein
MKILSFPGAPQFTHSVKALHHKLHLWERTWLYQKTREGLAIHSFFGYAICTPRDALYGVQPINLG